MLFVRSAENPIVTPSHRWWEARAVLNPAAVIHDARVALLYRAVGADGLSRVGICWTRDGERIDERSDLPLYEGAIDDPWARLGVEDARVTPLNGQYYLTYCKASVDTADHPPLSWETAPFRVRSAVAVTNDLRTVRELATVLPDTNSKDMVLFPELVGGKYAALIRIYPSIQYITSPDLRTWSDPITVMDPVPGTWQGERVGAGPPPIRTPWGWLLLYHGNKHLLIKGNQRLYSMGLAVLDAENPARVVYRHPEPVFVPEAEYEVNGPVGNVVFGTGLVERDGRLSMYYGAGDGVIGVAHASIKEVYDLIKQGMGDR